MKCFSRPIVPPFLFLALTVLVAGQPGPETRNFILITVDGLRPQELFSGADQLLLNNPSRSGIEDREEIADKYWRGSPKERREVLMPFFWKTFVPAGMVLGDRASGARVSVANPQRVSFPGYAELLTGQVQMEITGNIPQQIPRETTLEFVRRKLELDSTGVAAFTSWNHFPFIVQHVPGSITVNAGGPLPENLQTPELRLLAQLEARTLSPWGSVRQNSFTEGLAFAYLREYRPRVLYLSFDETDEWAHGRRYDRVLQAIENFDETLRLLWDLLQSMEGYRDNTNLLITTDHGRGRTLEDWVSHGSDVPGSEEIWIAMLGPDIPARGVVENHPPLFQTQVSATILRLMKLDPDEYNPEAGAAIEYSAFR